MDKYVLRGKRPEEVNPTLPDLPQAQNAPVERAEKVNYPCRFNNHMQFILQKMILHTVC